MLRRHHRVLTPLVALVLLSGCLGASDAPPGALVDATGQVVDLSDLSRIVPTSHDLVEILFEFGHDARVAGVPNWIDHPVDSKTLPLCTKPDRDPQVPCALGKPHVIHVEEILLAEPSLVLVKDHPLQPTDLTIRLRQVGVPVFVFANDETLDNIRTTYETVAKILQAVDPTVAGQAAHRVAGLDDEVRALRETVRSSGAPTPVSVYQLPAAFVAGKGTSADLLLELAGARNLASEAGIQGYQQLSREVLVDRDPDRVVVSTTAGADPHTFFRNPNYETTTAARLGPETLFIADPAVTALVGPRFLEGVRKVAEWLHPVAFGLMTKEVKFDETGRTLTVTATATADAGPVSYRFAPGDGSTPRTDANGTFTHDYPSGTHTARLLIIDGEGRIHEERHTFQVN